MIRSGKKYLFVSDFDQTLSFNDSGLVLSRLIGVGSFEDRVKGLSDIHLVQQGGELAYLLLHDPEFRCVRKQHLTAVGKQIRLKENIQLLFDILRSGWEGHEFSFHVVSAAPEEVIQSALEGIVPGENIHGTRFRYSDTGEIESIVTLPAGYGKVAVVDGLRAQMRIGHNNVVYVG